MSTGEARLSLAVLLTGGLALSLALAQSPSAQSQPAPSSAQPATTGSAPVPLSSKTEPPAKAKPASSAGPSAKKTAAAAPAKSAPSPLLPSRFGGRAGVYYRMVWGVDSLSVKWAESGELVRFSYRVLDPQRAAPLNDKRIEPSLIDPRAGVSLVIPVMEKIGQLRQVSTPESGKSYWMAFSNAGRLVKRGDRVDVVIGPFRAENLVVD
jgi:hypothetical protein